MTFPKIKSYSFFIAAFIETNNSGIDVPSATTVRPIIDFSICKKSAIPTAPLIKKSEPKTTSNNPEIIKNSILINLISFNSSLG